jgi:hypothetical protein
MSRLHRTRATDPFDGLSDGLGPAANRPTNIEAIESLPFEAVGKNGRLGPLDAGETRMSDEAYAGLVLAASVILLAAFAAVVAFVSRTARH